MRDLEDVAEWVSHHRSSIAVGRVERFLEHLRAGIDGALKRLVSGLDVYVQEGGERFALSRRGDHDDGVADAALRRVGGLNVASCGEHLAKKPDLRRNLIDDSRRHGPVTGTRSASRHTAVSHRGVEERRLVRDIPNCRGARPGVGRRSS
jgi:hypothetical protein